MNNSAKRDLKAGVAIDEIADSGMLSGQIDGEDALLLRQGGELFAVGALCTHYHADLAGGLLAGTVLRCPMHHAQFDIRTGQALCAPAFDALPCWHVHRIGNRVFAGERVIAMPAPKLDGTARSVIVGAGAAGLAAAEMFRRRIRRRVAMIGADGVTLRPAELVKGLPRRKRARRLDAVRPESWYAEHRIELLLNTRVDAVDVARHTAGCNLRNSTARGTTVRCCGSRPDPVLETSDIPEAAPGQVPRCAALPTAGR